ncbi:hypothetical protein MMC18_007061 [Xylographa bjoerkii]|nr:hypothetical protein [Xylographa bjoerkii]
MHYLKPLLLLAAASLGTATTPAPVTLTLFTTFTIDAVATAAPKWTTTASLDCSHGGCYQALGPHVQTPLVPEMLSEDDELDIPLEKEPTEASVPDPGSSDPIGLLRTFRCSSLWKRCEDCCGCNDAGKAICNGGRREPACEKIRSECEKQIKNPEGVCKCV